MSRIGSALSARVVTNFDELNTFAGAWGALLAQTPLGSAFESPEWVRAYWRHLASPRDTLSTTVVFDRSRPVAIFPAMLSRSGRLSFIGSPLSNYAGPVYEPDLLEAALSTWSGRLAAMRALRAIDLLGIREGSPFLAAMKAGSLSSWGWPIVVHRYACPEVDLSGGWDNVVSRHKSKTRSTWRRYWRRLSELGDLEFVEHSDPEAIVTALPRLFELFESRWEGKRITGGFQRHLQPLHLSAAHDLAVAGRVLLSTLRMDGRIIAFNYGLRAADTTTCFALAYDPEFSQHSPGLLLLVRILEAAAERGDLSYDFSLGEHPYKALWATGYRSVYRLLWGRGRRWHEARVRARVAASSVPALRRLKVEGPRSLLSTWRDQTKSGGPRPR